MASESEGMVQVQKYHDEMIAQGLVDDDVTRYLILRRLHDKCVVWWCFAGLFSVAVSPVQYSMYR